MNTLFIILRIITGISSVTAFIVLSLVVFLRDTASTAKEGIGVLGYAAKLFATGFTEGKAPKTEPWQIGPWQIIIGLLSLAMLVSVFTPGSRWFLHGVAALTVIVMLGYAKMIFTGASMEIACLPFLVVWLGYYAMSIFWQSHPASP